MQFSMYTICRQLEGVFYEHVISFSLRPRQDITVKLYSAHHTVTVAVITPSLSQSPNNAKESWQTSNYLDIDLLSIVEHLTRSMRTIECLNPFFALILEECHCLMLVLWRRSRNVTLGM